jgi:nicotinic acid mononucleotide adenylyltransferase
MKKVHQNSVFHFVIGADIIPTITQWGNGDKLKA